MTQNIAIQTVEHIENNGPFATAMARCWREVANSGGAIGFPFPPIDLTTALGAVHRLGGELERGHRFILSASVGDELVGWVTVRLNDSPLTAHWGKLEHLQSHPSRRAQGVGTALLRSASECARALGLDQLILFARSGEELEAFYERFGWTEIGRHHGALRFGEDDPRDEVMMQLRL